tara:strand:- start:81 stop:476 length:396 start_codon:yes stop_codon:yes gene_type:complete
MSSGEAIAKCECGHTSSFPVNITGHVTTCQNCGQQLVLQPYSPPASPAITPTPSIANFKVVPFKANIKEGQDLSVAGKQLENVLNEHEQQGWEYVRMEKVSITVSPGCLAALFSAGPSTATYDYIIFKHRS